MVVRVYDHRVFRHPSCDGQWVRHGWERDDNVRHPTTGTASCWLADSCSNWFNLFFGNAGKRCEYTHNAATLAKSQRRSLGLILSLLFTGCVQYHYSILQRKADHASDHKGTVEYVNRSVFTLNLLAKHRRPRTREVPGGI